MRIEQIREALQRQPFQPFTLRLKNGRHFYIPYAEMVAVTGGRLIVQPDQGLGEVTDWMGPEQIECLDKEVPMVIEAIREAIRKQPFQPFTLRLADGRELPVLHPEFIAISGRTVIVTNATNEAYSVVEPLLIISIEFAGAALAGGTNPGGNP